MSHEIHLREVAGRYGLTSLKTNVLENQRSELSWEVLGQEGPCCTIPEMLRLCTP